MDNKMYTKVNIYLTAFSIAAALSAAGAAAHGFTMESFKFDALLSILIVVFILSFCLMLSGILWTFRNKVGREYWEIYCANHTGMKFLLRQGTHPADRMKRLMFAVIVVVAAAVIMQQLFQ